MRVRIMVGAAALLAMAAGCTQTRPVAMPAVASDVTYGLGAGDDLRVIVFGEDRLSGEYHVTDAGLVVLPLIGPVKASGRTVEQLGAAIAAAFRSGGFLTAPRVAVEVLAYRPFFILGEVAKPGQYPFIPGMTVAQAIATANGYTYRARKAEVRITHWGETKQTSYRLDPGAKVAPGDTITVPERHF